MRNPFTALRKEILDRINASDHPLNAKDIHKMKINKANLSTIYRALKYLESQDLIEGVNIHCCEDENIRYYYGSDHKHQHFIHCENCHQFTLFEKCFIGKHIDSIEKKYHYEIRHHSLFFTGLCDKCRKQLNKKNDKTAK